MRRLGNQERKGHVLVVDDEAEVRNLVRQALEAAGHTCIVAADGRNAIDLLAEREFDAVVCDLRMPDGDGLDVLRQFAEVAPETPVIIVTAFADVDGLRACMRAGAFDVIEKPMTLPDLVDSVERALKKRRSAAEVHAQRFPAQLLKAGARCDGPGEIVDAIAQLMNAEVASLMLPREDGQLYISHSRGLPEAIARNAEVTLGEGAAGRVAVERKPVLLQSNGPQDPVFRGVVGGRRIRSSIVFPLVTGDCLVGVLNLSRVERTEPFRQRDVDRLSFLSVSIVLAIENARLMRQLAANERLVAIGQLATGIAHEINNPVTWVMSSITLLQDTVPHGGGSVAPDDACQAHEAISDALEGVQRIRDIVRDVRALARTDDHLDATFDLNEAVRAALRVCTPEIRACGAGVRFTPGESAEVVGSAGRLSQVFINLLVNAAQAVSGLAQARRLVELAVRRDGDRVVAEITDRGSGIQPEHLRRVFEPFFSTKTREGTGLGLFICREIVRKHGGVMVVESTPGVCTTFTIHLPSASPDSAFTTREAIRALPAPAGRPRVLFVDDEELVCRAYQRTLSAQFDVTLAVGGRAAIKVLESGRPFDVIVSDIMMPDVGGFELFDWLKLHRPPLADRVIFATGGLGHENVRDRVRRSGRGVLEKPLEMCTVRACVDELLAASGST